MKAMNIEWDVDYEEDLKLLPIEIDIPDGMEDEEEISDYITDVTGFCHKGYVLVDNETFTAFVYEDNGIIAADLSIYDSKEKAVAFAKARNWDEVVNDVTGEVVWKRRGGNEMEIRYYVCGLGYDENDCVVDYEVDFGDFDTYEEAYECFVKVQCSDPELLFSHPFASYQMLVQLEECEEDDEEINCIDVKNEWWIENPNFKEEM